MRKLFYFQFLLFFITSCAIHSTSEVENSTLFTIEGSPTLADEFLYVYEKNNFNNDRIYTEKDVDEYFELFINFKLKVQAAKSAGIDTTTSFLDEYKTYRNQLIKPYLSESREKERLIKEAYDRMKYEIDASHILVTVDQNAPPADTVIAYQKIMEIREKALSGENFGALAVKLSDDPSARTNHGRLGYFTAFQMVFPFEDAAYNTPVDSISDILRSRFGYHILKVHDKRPSSGKVKVSHIMLRVDGSRGDTVSVRNKIFEIHDQLLGGADWGELCQKYSEDQRTKNTGGTLPFISLKQINDAAFENVAFGLQDPGEISDPVRSRFGWHIIKLEDKKGLEPLDEIKESLEQRVSKGERMKLSQQAVISRLKSQHNFEENTSIRERLVQLADSSLLKGKWDISLANPFLLDSIFSISEDQYDVEALIDHVKKRQRGRPDLAPEAYMNELIDEFIGKCLLKYEEDHLVTSNREFRMLLNEYYEGILLFEIMNQNVWGKAVEDSLGLQNYFQRHQQSYHWGRRVDAAIISTKDETILEEIKESIDGGPIQLFQTEIGLDDEGEVLKNPSLDSMVSVFRRYDKSAISIYVNDGSITSGVYPEMMQYLKDLGLPQNSIMRFSEDDPTHKIRLVLNSESKKSLEYLYNKESALTLQVIEGLFERGDNQLIDSLEWKAGVYDIVSNGDYTIIVIDKILEEQPKALKEVKGAVISDYQNELEQRWIEELRSKYTLDVNYATLDKIKKAYRKKLDHSD